MAVSKELLEYQKVDAELRKIEQEISQSEERRKYIQAKKFMETAAEKLEGMDARARELKEMAMRLTYNYQELNKAISEYAEIDEMVEAGGDVSFYKKKVQGLTDQLRSLKNELNKLVSEIENASEEYQRMKKQTISMQKQYKEYNEKFKEVKNSRAAEVKAINEKLEKIGKNIPSDILARYKAKRRDRIFPVIVPLTNGRCICGMDFAIAQQSALEGGNIIECEHCRRFIYKE